MNMQIKEILKQVVGWILIPYVKIPKLLYKKWENKCINKYIRGFLVSCIGIVLLPIWLTIIVLLLNDPSNDVKVANKVEVTITNTPIVTNTPTNTPLPTNTPTNTPIPTPTPTTDPKVEFNQWVSVQFSAWDGSCYELVKLVKKNMNDDDSFEHVETRYTVGDYNLIVTMKFRGNNAFGGKVLNTVKAKLDYKTKIIKIIE